MSVKNYPHVNLDKQCPFALLNHNLDCKTCRLAIQRYTDQEMENLVKKKGKPELRNQQYSCILVANLIEAQQINISINELDNKLNDMIVK